MSQVKNETAGKISAFRRITPEGSNFITAKLKSLGHLNVELVRDIYPSEEGNRLTANIVGIFTNAGCNMTSDIFPGKTIGVVFIWNENTYNSNALVKFALTERFARELGEQDPNEWIKWRTNLNVDLIVVIGHRSLL